MLQRVRYEMDAMFAYWRVTCAGKKETLGAVGVIMPDKDLRKSAKDAFALMREIEREQAETERERVEKARSKSLTTEEFLAEMAESRRQARAEGDRLAPLVAASRRANAAREAASKNDEANVRQPPPAKQKCHVCNGQKSYKAKVRRGYDDIRCDRCKGKGYL